MKTEVFENETARIAVTTSLRKSYRFGKPIEDVQKERGGAEAQATRRATDAQVCGSREATGFDNCVP